MKQWWVKGCCVAAFLCITAAGLLYYPPFFGGAPPVSRDASVVGISADGRVNINTATALQLELLPGIGEAKARAIVEYREEYGAFAAPEELMQVKGIGEKTFAELEHSICI